MCAASHAPIDPHVPRDLRRININVNEVQSILCKKTESRDLQPKETQMTTTWGYMRNIAKTHSYTRPVHPLWDRKVNQLNDDGARIKHFCLQATSITSHIAHLAIPSVPEPKHCHAQCAPQGKSKKKKKLTPPALSSPEKQFGVQSGGRWTHDGHSTKQLQRHPTTPFQRCCCWHHSR